MLGNILWCVIGLVVGLVAGFFAARFFMKKYLKENKLPIKLSRNLLLDVAEKENAVRRFGRAVRIDIQIMDKAIENY